jgi:hypothetical protein
MIFVPSIARPHDLFEIGSPLAIVTAAVEASATVSLNRASRTNFWPVGVLAAYRHDGTVCGSTAPAQPDFTIDLTHPNIWLAIRGSFRTLFGSGTRMLRVLGPSTADSAETVEVLLDERPLHDEMWDFGIRILELSIVISLVTAALVYLSLQWLLVRQMRRITASMMNFREDPEDASRMIAASKRKDEIGVAERELSVLQRTVPSARAARAAGGAGHRGHKD